MTVSNKFQSLLPLSCGKNVINRKCLSDVPRLWPTMLAPRTMMDRGREGERGGKGGREREEGERG